MTSPKSMHRKLVVWFEDMTATPERVFGEAIPAKGLPDKWLDCLVGDCKVLERRYAANEVLAGALIEVPPLQHPHDTSLVEHLTLTLRNACQMLGTNSWIRNFDEMGYRAAWESNMPLFSERT